MLKLTEFIAQNEEPKTIKGPEEDAEHELLFLLAAIKVIIKPETLQQVQSLKFLLYRLGYNFLIEKDVIGKTEQVKRYYFKIRCRLPFQENEFRVMFGESVQDKEVKSAWVLIESGDIVSSIYMQKVMSLAGVKYSGFFPDGDFIDSGLNDLCDLPETHNSIVEFPEIDEAVNFLKHQGIGET